MTSSDRGTTYYAHSYPLDEKQREIRDWVVTNAASSELEDQLRRLQLLAWRGSFTVEDRRAVRAWLFDHHGVERPAGDGADAHA